MNKKRQYKAYSNDEMMKRVVRFKDLRKQGIPAMFIDSVLPGHTRMNYAVLGDTASENPEFKPAISEPHQFQIGMGYAPTGCGPAWHTHDYVEMFLVLEGKWRFYWGYDDDPAKPQGEVTLGKWDMISLPPGIYRGFEVTSKKPGWWFAVLDPHPVFLNKDPIWSPYIERMAEKVGFRADATGKMVKPANYDKIRKKLEQHLTRLVPGTGVIEVNG
jgi:quercetin dioxygenase-like cupin family protein